jgi:hypothetical protein
MRAVNMMIAVFWNLKPCSLVEVYCRFRGTFCSHHQKRMYAKNGGSIFLSKVGNHLPGYKASPYKRQTFLYINILLVGRAI